MISSLYAAILSRISLQFRLISLALSSPIKRSAMLINLEHALTRHIVALINNAVHPCVEDLAGSVPQNIPDGQTNLFLGFFKTFPFFLQPKVGYDFCKEVNNK